MRNRPQSRILNRLGIRTFCGNRVSGHYDLEQDEKQRILEILNATKDDLPAGWL